jgi:hypothetical protein
MKFSPDTCITCGSRYRPTFDSEYLYDDYITDNRGTFRRTPFWFCSDDCFLEAVTSLVDKRFQPGRTPETDPQCPDMFIEEFIEQWNIQATNAYTKANHKFRMLAVTAYEHYLHDLEKTQKKEHVQLQADADRQLKQMENENRQKAQQVQRDQKSLEREQEQLYRLKRQVQQDDERRERQEKLDAQRELDRQEKIRKEAEREEERQIEQERHDQQERYEQAYEQAHVDDHLRERENLFVPQPIPRHLRYEHIHVLAPTGAGKTTLLQHLLLKDFHDYGREAAHVVIDPKGAMIDRIAKLQVFDYAWADRIVIIDPFDRPAFNIFSSTSLNAAQLISNFAYIFSTAGQKLTTPQETCFSYCVSLLLKIPNANLWTLLDLLDDGAGRPPRYDERFATTIKSLTDPQDFPLKRFFERDYYQTYSTTRDLIKSRVNTILKEPNIAAMLNSRTCKIDIADCIENKKVVLVNTQLVKMAETHQVLGRLIISLFQQAVFGRTSTHPAFLFIDEFQEFADEQKTPQLLRLIREYKGGAVLAHQNMVCAELSANTQNAISTNTIIKFASRPAGDDLHRAARDLCCDQDFLTKVCVKNADNSVMRFGCYFPPLKHPFVYQVRHEINNYPSVPDQRYQEFRARNRATLLDPPVEKAPQPPAMPQTHEPPKTAGLHTRPTGPTEVNKPITTQRASSSGPAPNESSSSQDHEITLTQPPPDPSAPARWGQLKK